MRQPATPTLAARAIAHPFHFFMGYLEGRDMPGTQAYLFPPAPSRAGRRGTAGRILPPRGKSVECREIGGVLISSLQGFFLSHVSLTRREEPRALDTISLRRAGRVRPGGPRRA